MDTGLISLSVVLVVVLLGAGVGSAGLGAERRRSQQLRDRLGLECDRGVEQHG